MTEVIAHSVMITGFIFTMMLVLEYVNIFTRGRLEGAVKKVGFSQTFFSAFLGATPGCLGAFAVTSLYSHRIVSFGSLVACMVATCGDEAFLMLALCPEKALILFAFLFVGGLISGFLLDLFRKHRTASAGEVLADYKGMHHGDTECTAFPALKDILGQWRKCTPQRGWLSIFLILFLFGVFTGMIGEDHHAEHPADFHPNTELTHVESSHRHATEDVAVHGHDHSEWGWVRITLLLVAATGLFIVATVPDHFLEEHLWKHLVLVHLWKIFLWTFGTLTLMHLLMRYVHIDQYIQGNLYSTLIVACLIGLIPQSGPHMIFVSLCAKGVLPMSILLANSIVQDGHGMLPLLAHSRRAFLAVKTIKLILGLAIGAIALFFGY